MILGIDASNIRVGGGLTHLKGLLRYIDKEKFDIEFTDNEIEEMHNFKLIKSILNQKISE